MTPPTRVETKLEILIEALERILNGDYDPESPMFATSRIAGEALAAAAVADLLDEADEGLVALVRDEMHAGRDGPGYSTRTLQARAAIHAIRVIRAVNEHARKGRV